MSDLGQDYPNLTFRVRNTRGRHTVDDRLEHRLRDAMPAVDYCSFRAVRRNEQLLSVRRGVISPPSNEIHMGVMVSVMHRGGYGYAATQDLSAAGLKAAVSRALEWTEVSAQHVLFEPAKFLSQFSSTQASGEYETPVERSHTDLTLSDKLDILRAQCEQLKSDPRIIDWGASLWQGQTETLFITSNNTRIRQTVHQLSPDMYASASNGAELQTRSLGSRGESQQGGLEVMERIRYTERASTIASEALALLDAQNCPDETTTVVLAPDQMMLQIHESIGHPLELDRLLGDERNYAGTSFVTMDMFGSYQYGSPLLNVTFDPTLSYELAAYGYDDDGAQAEKTYLIKDGVLQRPMGGALSQFRAKTQGVANARASSWNRPPIDRMANLNIEPGQSTFDELIKDIERGVYMATNSSWSIDDSRNKFQFGCEWGQLIEDGQLTRVVKNPNYRGISATFWRSLTGVGNAGTVSILGTPYCGKGEPNQAIQVGHASPACRFENIDVFGGS